MVYKLSNRIGVEQLEAEFNASFQFPGVHVPKTVIDGLKESNVPIITMDSPQYIWPSIWGILPEDFSDDWEVFQKYRNTLNVPASAIDSNVWYREAFRSGRCLILVTGFYTGYIADGELFPFHVSHVSGKPFSLAGIYNQLNDGFYTCSLINCRANNNLRHLHNLTDTIPLAIQDTQREQWLDTNLPLQKVRNLLQLPTKDEFKAMPVSKRILDLGNATIPKDLATFADESPMPIPLLDILTRNHIYTVK